MIKLILFLSLSVILHELGHLIAAKISKMKVEKFCIFLDWKFDLIQIIYKGTNYSIGWIPLGGYIKIKDLFVYTLLRESRRKKYFVLLAGGITNIILAIIFFDINREFAIVNLLIAGFNLFPLNKNDGYYIFNMITDNKKKHFKDFAYINYYEIVIKDFKTKIEEEYIYYYYRNGYTAEKAIENIKIELDITQQK